MTETIKKIVEFLRFTKIEWIDHNITARLLLMALLPISLLIGLILGDGVHVNLSRALFVAVFCVIAFEIWQYKTGNGKMEVSDMASGMIGAIDMTIIILVILHYLDPELSKMNFWAGLGGFIFLAPWWYLLVYKQLRPKPKKQLDSFLLKVWKPIKSLILKIKGLASKKK